MPAKGPDAALMKVDAVRLGRVEFEPLFGPEPRVRFWIGREGVFYRERKKRPPGPWGVRTFGWLDLTGNKHVLTRRDEVEDKEEYRHPPQIYQAMAQRDAGMVSTTELAPGGTVGAVYQSGGKVYVLSWATDHRSRQVYRLVQATREHKVLWTWFQKMPSVLVTRLAYMPLCVTEDELLVLGHPTKTNVLELYDREKGLIKRFEFRTREQDAAAEKPDEKAPSVKKGLISLYQSSTGEQDAAAEKPDEKTPSVKIDWQSDHVAPVAVVGDGQLLVAGGPFEFRRAALIDLTGEVQARFEPPKDAYMPSLRYVGAGRDFLITYDDPTGQVAFLGLEGEGLGSVKLEDEENCVLAGVVGNDRLVLVDRMEAPGLIVYEMKRGPLKAVDVAEPDKRDAGTGQEMGLHQAAYKGQLAQVRRLIAMGQKVNARDEDGNTPLHLAASAGETETVAELIARGARIGAVSSDGDTALHKAISENHLSVAVLLVRKGADPNAMGSLGTPIYLVARMEWQDPRDAEKFAELFLKAGVDPNKRVGRKSVPLYAAAERGNVRVVAALLAHGAKADRKDLRHGATALHVAAEEGRTDVVKLLLARGADVTVRKRWSGYTPLHYAVARGSKEIVEMLLAVPQTDVNLKDTKGISPLQLARGGRRLEIARLLLERGAKPQAVDTDAPMSDGMSELHHAARDGNIAWARLMLEHGGDLKARDSLGRNPLDVAVARAEPEVVEFLLAQGADVNAADRRGETALHRLRTWSANAEEKAARQKIFAALLKAGADPNAMDGGGRTPLHAAAELDNVVVVRLLLQHGAQVNARDVRGETAVHVAIGRFQDAAAKLLIESGADIHARTKKYGRTPLHLAATKGLTGTVRLLLARGADIEAKNHAGNTPLLVAVAHNTSSERASGDLGEADRRSKEMVELLLGAGADVHAQGERGRTALHWAARAHLEGPARALLAGGANVNARTALGRTPLLFAAWTGAQNVMLVLIEHGALIGATSPLGTTPLHGAASRGRKGAATLLLEKGADVNAKDKKGRTPLSVARNDAIRKLLKEHGARP